jgi:hypothetical protein
MPAEPPEDDPECPVTILDAEVAAYPDSCPRPGLLDPESNAEVCPNPDFPELDM